MKRRKIERKRECLSTLSTDATCQLDVFGHDGDTLGVDGAQVGVLKQTHQVGLAGLLQTETEEQRWSAKMIDYFCLSYPIKGTLVWTLFG